MMIKKNFLKEYKVIFFIFAIMILLFSIKNVYANTWDNIKEGTDKVFEYVSNKADDILSDIFNSSRTSESTGSGFSIGEELTNYVADSALNGFVAWCYNLYTDATNTFVGVVFSEFSPQVDTFIKYTAGSDAYFSVFTNIGTSLAVFIYAFMMICVAFGTIRLAEVKENPLQLTGKLVMAIVLIYYARPITDFFYEIAYGMWDNILSISNTELEIGEVVAKGLIPTGLIETLNVGAAGAFNSSPIGMIMTILFGCIFAVQFVKFAIEIIERYIVSCLLYYIFPIPAATIVSKNSSAVLKKYIQMLIVQLLMLLMNLFFIKIIVNMIIAISIQPNIISWFFMLAFMKVAMKIDNYAFTMGLSVAVTGGSFMDAAQNSMRNLMYMTNGFQRGINNAGGALQTMGAARGSSDLIGFGMKMQDIVNPGRAGGNGRDMASVINKADRLGNAGKILSNIKPSDIDASMVDMAKNGRYRGQINSLPENTKEALFQKAYGENILPQNAQLEQLAWGMDGSVTGNMKQQTEDGQKLSSAFKLSPTPSNDAIRTFSDDTGNEMYLTTRNALQDGMSLPYDFDKSDPEALSMAECISGKSFASLGDTREDVAIVTGLDNGEMVLKDISGDTVAKIDKVGNISYNTDASLSSDTLSSLPSFKDIQDMKLKNNDNGTVTVRGMSNDHLKEMTLYNKALYNKDDVAALSGSRNIRSFGNNNSDTGAWYITDVNLKDKTVYSESLNKYSEMNDTQVFVPAYKKHKE